MHCSNESDRGSSSFDFVTIPVSAHPAYTWLWNSTITEDGIRAQLDEMYQSGIRAFYVLGEPNNFRPTRRRTHLNPDYLSDRYMKLLRFAFDYAREKGMYMWLYDEGGFPSGMVCGQIRSLYPALAQKRISMESVLLKKGEPYIPSPQSLAAFIGEQRVSVGESFADDVYLTEYLHTDDPNPPIQSDIAKKQNSDLFLQLTHERMKSCFGDHFGSSITLMFDDEAQMGTWTNEFDQIFMETYGYDIANFLPYVTNQAEPKTLEQHRAKSDYAMLCGDLVRRNFFIPVREWLRREGLYLTGHLNNDNKSDSCLFNRYGNFMRTLREFDVPGIDVIWEQIDFPQNGSSCFEGMEFFPRLASSAARQNGHSRCVSESFAVYGAQVTPERMRYVVNYQAVRGISLFNFMAISYDQSTAMAFQFRPNFQAQVPSMNQLHAINDYTARISHLLQSTKAEVTVALYHPARSICAGGDVGRNATESFDAMGHELERRGVVFDIIDEDFVRNARVENGRLISDHVAYDCVWVPVGAMEKEEITTLLSAVHQDPDPSPCVIRRSKHLQARKLLFSNGDEGYFICNTANETVSETIEIFSLKKPYRIDLMSGDRFSISNTRRSESLLIPISLLRGEAVFLLCSDQELSAKEPPQTVPIATLSDFYSQIHRIYTIEAEHGTINRYPAPTTPPREGLYEWDPDFSGEVTYTSLLPNLADGSYVLDLGDVRHTATVFIDDTLIGTATMPPYRIPFQKYGIAKELTVIVANTAANACAHSDFFEKTPIEDVGPYHKRMKPAELREVRGGLIGPVRIERIIC